MSSAVEATALATPPPGVPPGLIPGTPDLYATTGPYGLFRFDPGRCDVSDWLGPGTDDDEGSAAVTDGSDALPYKATLRTYNIQANGQL